MLRILHVEDSPLLCEVLAHRCKHLNGVLVKSVNYPEEFESDGLDIGGFGAADVLVVDYDLKSSLTGVHVITRALSIKPSILIIGNSGHEEHNLELSKAGAHITIGKYEDMGMNKMIALLDSIAAIKNNIEAF